MTNSRNFRFADNTEASGHTQSAPAAKSHPVKPSPSWAWPYTLADAPTQGNSRYRGSDSLFAPTHLFPEPNAGDSHRVRLRQCLLRRLPTASSAEGVRSLCLLLQGGRPVHYRYFKFMAWIPVAHCSRMPFVALRLGSLPCSRSDSLPLLVACRREIVTTDAVRRVGVLPVDRLSIG